MTSSRNNESGRSWIQQNALGVIIVGLLTVALVVVGLGILLEGRLDTLENNVVTRPALGVEMAPVDSATETLTVGATIYVPVYSHIYENGGNELLLETTLSIRNTDPSREIVVEAVMVGTTGNRALAFARPARLVSVRDSDTSGRAN